MSLNSFLVVVVGMLPGRECNDIPQTLKRIYGDMMSSPTPLTLQDERNVMRLVADVTRVLDLLSKFKNSFDRSATPTLGERSVSYTLFNTKASKYESKYQKDDILYELTFYLRVRIVTSKHPGGFTVSLPLVFFTATKFSTEYGDDSNEPMLMEFFRVPPCTAGNSYRSGMRGLHRSEMRGLRYKTEDDKLMEKLKGLFMGKLSRVYL